MVNLVPVKVADSDSLVNIIVSLNKYKQREWLLKYGTTKRRAESLIRTLEKHRIQKV